MKDFNNFCKEVLIGFGTLFLVALLIKSTVWVLGH
jgi:hypothetical protein